jgi:hypothetical protein
LATEEALIRSCGIIQSYQQNIGFEMLVRMTVPCCDFTDERFSGGVDGGGYLARAAGAVLC